MISKTPYFDALDDANCFIGESATSDALRSGTDHYASALVVRAVPFVLISHSGDMLWTQKKREDVDIRYSGDIDSLRFRKALTHRQSDFPKINGDREYKPLLLGDYFSEPGIYPNNDLYLCLSYSTEIGHVKASIYVEPDVVDRKTAASLLVKNVRIYKTPYHRMWLIVMEDSEDAYLAQEDRRWIMPVEYKEAITALHGNDMYGRPQEI